MTDPAPPSLLAGFHAPRHPLPLVAADRERRGLLFPAGTRPPDPDADPVRRVERGLVHLAFDVEAAIAEWTGEAGLLDARPWFTRFPMETRWIPASVRDRLMDSSLRRRLARPEAFPRWPIEECVERIRQRVWEAARAAGLAGEAEPFWPGRSRYVAGLSHDIDTPEVFRRGDWCAFADIEESFGFRSSWHVCSEHVPYDQGALDELRRRGHEIAWHGVRHDYGMAFAAPDRLQRVLRRERPLLDRLGIAGFRSPMYLRTRTLFRSLEGAFLYDSSCRDTAPEFGTRQPRRGCCTVFPFMRGDLVELPVTIPEDHVVASLTGDDAGAIAEVQSRKLAWIRAAGGLALSLTHPLRWLSLKPGAFRAYRTLLETLAADRECRVLPARDIASWWRRRCGGTISAGPAPPPAGSRTRSAARRDRGRSRRGTRSTRRGTRRP